MKRNRGVNIPVPPGSCIHGHNGCPTWMRRPEWCDTCHQFHCRMIPAPDNNAWE